MLGDIHHYRAAGYYPTLFIAYRAHRQVDPDASAVSPFYLQFLVADFFASQKPPEHPPCRRFAARRIGIKVGYGLSHQLLTTEAEQLGGAAVGPLDNAVRPAGQVGVGGFFVEVSVLLLPQL
jgi:hypothetical protein